MRLGNPVITSFCLPVEQDPAGWVWLNQQPLVISSFAAETRWPEFVDRARREFGISTMVLVPLTAGDNRLGAFGFSSVAPYEPSPAETGVPGASCQRVRRRRRVLPRQAGSSPGAGPAANAVRHHQCAGIEAVARRVVFRHIRAALKSDPARFLGADAAQDETGSLDVYALHSTDPQLVRGSQGTVQPGGDARGRGARNRKARSGYAISISTAIPTRIFGGLWHWDSNPICSVPLITRDRTLGTLALSRMTDDAWTPEDVEFLVQVARPDCHRGGELARLIRELPK